jgi:hypothetical protein
MRNLVQRAFTTTITTHCRSPTAGARPPLHLLRIIIIIRRGRGRRNKPETDTFRRRTHVGIVAHRGADATLSSPEYRGAGVQLWDALDPCGAETDEVGAGEEGVGAYVEGCESGA